MNFFLESPQVSFFFLLQSFFIDKEENHLFVNIVLSFIVVYIAVYFACSRKKEEVPSNVSLLAKIVSLFKTHENGILTFTTNTEFTENWDLFNKKIINF